MSSLSLSQMKPSIYLPDTFCDNLRQLMHNIFNISYADFSYDLKYNIVTFYGPCIKIPYHTEYLYEKESFEPTQSHRLRYQFSKTKLTVWKTSGSLDGSNEEKEERVYTMAGVKEWTSVELMHLKRQLIKMYPLDIIVGPCVEGV